MQTTDLFDALVRNQIIYELLHARTAETDIQIMRLYSTGKNAVQISMAIPCAEATVYRAKARVKKFLYEELPEYREKDIPSVYIHNAIGIDIWDLSIRAWKLYLMCIWTYQNFKNTIDGKLVHERLPGLRNQNQRECILSELNEFWVVPDEMPERKVKIFEFVTYDNAEYAFALTKEARPYYDKFYALLKILGVDDKEITYSH